jgi:hypothetical protein
MMRPHIEARALLGAHGFQANFTDLLKPRFHMADDARYALLRHPSEKPFVYDSADALARRIHRDRRGAALDIGARPVMLWPRGRPEGIATVKVFALDDGQPHRLLGYAYLDNSDRCVDALKAALERAEPRQFEVAA